MMRCVMLIPLLVQAGLAEPVAAQECPTVPSHLEGQLTFRGDAWNFRLHAPANPVATGDSVAGELDLPALLMAGRPVRLRCSDDSLLLELPFGFGELALRTSSEGESWRGASTLAGDSLRLDLRESEAPPYSIRNVDYGSGDVRLSGQIFVPHGTEPRAGVVVVHGSGAQGLNMLEYRSWGDFYARLGVTALIYDKRGVGGSTGDFPSDSAFQALTIDALAGVELLREMPEVDERRVGIAGHSQAGWIAFAAAERSRSVAFLSLLAAPTVSVAEQELQRVRYGMGQEGFSPEIVSRAVAHTRLMFSVASAPDAWEALVRSNARIAAEPWVEWVHRPASLENLRWWRTHAEVDPVPMIRELRIPIFAAYSLDDPVVPALHNAGLLREVAAATPGADITVVTVDGGNHRLELPAGWRNDGRWSLPRVHPDFIAALEEWTRWRWDG